MFTCPVIITKRFYSGVLFHRLFALVSTFFSWCIMSSLRRFDSFKRFMDRIHNWANPQLNHNNETNNNENSNQNSNFNVSSGGNNSSTTRPSEGEEQENAAITTEIVTTIKTKRSSYNNNNNVDNNSSEHLSEVLVVPVNDTKIIEAPTTKTTRTTLKQVATKIKNSCGNVMATNNEATKSERSNSNNNSNNVAIAPIARAEEEEEEYAVEVWAASGGKAEEGEIGDRRMKQDYCCYAMNDSEEQAHVKAATTATTPNTSMLAVTVTLSSTSPAANAASAAAENPVQRSASRMRTYLKKCKERLTGHNPHQQQQQQQQHHEQEAVTSSTTNELNSAHAIPAIAAATTMNFKSYLEDEKCKASTASVEVSKKTDEVPMEEQEEDGETAEEKKELQLAAELRADSIADAEAEAGDDADETDGTLTELVYEDIDFSLTSTLMDNSSCSNISVDQQYNQQQKQQDNSQQLQQHAYPSLTLTPTKSNRDADTPPTCQTGSFVEIDAADDLAVEFEATSEKQQQQEQQQQQQEQQQQQRKQLIQKEGVQQHVELECLAAKRKGEEGENEKAVGEEYEEKEEEKLPEQQKLQQQTQQSQQEKNQPVLEFINSCPPLLVKEEQLACAIRVDSGTAALIDKHLAAIYPVFVACTRAILIRQARDILVCSYFGCLQTFEMQFLCKFAEIAAELRQRHAIGENVLWHKGWPLTTPTGEVILHLGALENALIRPGDLYLCVNCVNKTEAPQLYVVWRSASGGINLQQQQQLQQQLLPHASVTSELRATNEATTATTAIATTTNIQSRCIDLSATTTISILTLEMLTSSDELPQLLQHLLVGVEHSIERVSLNELQMSASSVTATTDETTNNNSKCSKSIVSAGGSSGRSSGNSSSSNSSSSNNNTNLNTITNSPKCALRRSELITKNKTLNSKFMLRRLTNRQDSMNSTSSGQSCGSSGSTSSDELLRCTTNNTTSPYNTSSMNNNSNQSHSAALLCQNGALLLDTTKMAPVGSTNSASSSPALPLFCLGNSFPHIDSDEENADEKRSSASAELNDRFECEIVPPASITEIPEKLLTTSGIYLPGTTDHKGHPLVTVDAECVLAAGLNCYEIATLLLFYSTITERNSTMNANDRTTQHQQQQQQQQQQTQPSQNPVEQPEPQPTSISGPLTPKKANTATTAAATLTTVSTSAATAPTPQLTSNITSVKSPAHAHEPPNATTTYSCNNNNVDTTLTTTTTRTPTFTILIAIEKSSQMCVIDLICQSLRLLTSQIAYCEILAVCLEGNLLMQQQQQQQEEEKKQAVATYNNTVVGSNSSNGENNESGIKQQSKQQQQEYQKQHQQQPYYSLKFISVNEVTTSVAPSQIPHVVGGVGCGGGKLPGLHHHDARKWREFFVALAPFRTQCATAAQRLVAAMNDIRSADLQGLPTRRQLYAQHRALSRALMDSELHNLRKRGAAQLAHLEELAKSYVATAVAAAAKTEKSTEKTTGSVAVAENSHSRNGNSSGNTGSNRYYYNSNNNSSTNRYNGSSGNKLLSTISSISHLGFGGGSYSFNVQHSQLQQQQQQTSQNSQSQNQRATTSSYSTLSKYSTMTSSAGTTLVATNAAAVGGAGGGAIAASDIGHMGNIPNIDIAIRLHKVTLLFNEVDRAAKRLEQLTEQRREQLRELTRQRALEDEINEVTSWITSDGNDTLQRFASLQLDCETAIKEQEQEFEKYYFISMKHLAKGRDLHDAAINIAALHESAVNLKSALDCFAEKLEMARERIEAASRLHQLATMANLDAHTQQEMQRLAEVAGAMGLLEKYRQKQQQQQQQQINTESTTSASSANDQTNPPAGHSETIDTANQSGSQSGSTNNQNTNNNTVNKPNSLNLSFNLNSYRSSMNSNNNTSALIKQQLQHVAVITSTPVPRMNRLSHRSSSGIGSFDGQTCQCWRESRNMEDMDEMLDAEGEELDMDEGEEEQSKIADSGVGGCERCEGNLKFTRVCSCQSLNEAANLYGKSDELDFECYERPVKRYADIHSPMEANAHLQYHASSLELSKLEELSCLDPKIQKTLLLIMREMIGTERDYVHSLNYVIENYIDELLREDIPQPLRGQRNVIFGNIEKIFEFHKWHFLNELERYERNPLKVGGAFLEMESKFYLYALYNKNKPKSDTLMSEYGTAFFKSKQFELNDKMDLASYLLKPVQRMGKYALLLQQLVKACNAVEGAALQEIAADVEELQRAEEMVKFQLRHGNDLLAMDSLRDCDVNVKEQGRLLRQNEFLVWQGRGGKKSLRQIFLFEDLVLFSKARRFPDQKNLDIYIYKNSIKTSDIGLTAHVGDSKTKFEIWFRKRKPEDTWTLQCMSEDIKNAWTEEISKLLWKQANRNREIRLAEMSSMGIGSKPCLDIRPSHNQINDRSITISQLGKAPKLRHSFAGMHLDGAKSARRPNSLISESSLSSGTSSSSLSTGGSSSGHERLGGGGGGGSIGGACTSKAATMSSHHHHQHHHHHHSHALELINETQALMLSGAGAGATTIASSASGSSTNTNTLSSSGSSGRSGHSSSRGGGDAGGKVAGATTTTTATARSKRSTTLVSQLSMESGIISDISMTPDQEQTDATCSWLNSTTTTTNPTTNNKSSPSAISTTATVGGIDEESSTVIMRRHRRYHHQHQQHHHQHHQRNSNSNNNKQHKELQQQQSAPAAFQEHILSLSNESNPYLREFKADSVNL